MTHDNDLIRRGDALALTRYDPVLKGVREDWAGMTADEDGDWVSFDEIAAIPAVAASQPADPVTNADSRQRVTVKPLVWEEQDGKSYRQANCVLGQYQVSFLCEFECWQLSRFVRSGQVWKETFSRHSNKDAAKAAAQADYEARILAAIDVQPDPRDAQIAALVEAVAGADSWLERWAVHVGNCSGLSYNCTCGLAFVRHEVRAALAAVKGGDA